MRISNCSHTPTTELTRLVDELCGPDLQEYIDLILFEDYNGEYNAGRTVNINRLHTTGVQLEIYVPNDAHNYNFKCGKHRLSQGYITSRIGEKDYLSKVALVLSHELAHVQQATQGNLLVGGEPLAVEGITHPEVTGDTFTSERDAELKAQRLFSMRRSKYAPEKYYKRLFHKVATAHQKDVGQGGWFKDSKRHSIAKIKSMRGR